MVERKRTVLQRNLEAITTKTKHKPHPLSVKSGCGPSFVRDVLSSKVKNPTNAKLKKVCVYLNISVDELTDSTKIYETLEAGGSLEDYLRNKKSTATTDMPSEEIMQSGFELMQNAVEKRGLDLTNQQMAVLASQLCKQMQETGSTTLDDVLVNFIVNNIDKLTPTKSVDVGK